MNLGARKLNLINWISSIQENNILEKVEKYNRKKTTGGMPLAKMTKMLLMKG